MNAMSVRPEELKLLAVSAGGAASGSLSERRHGSDEPEQLYTIEEIHIRAETVTPLLSEILNFHPSPHWGINE